MRGTRKEGTTHLNLSCGAVWWCWCWLVLLLMVAPNEFRASFFYIWCYYHNRIKLRFLRPPPSLTKFVPFRGKGVTPALRNKDKEIHSNRGLICSKAYSIECVHASKSHGSFGLRSEGSGDNP